MAGRRARLEESEMQLHTMMRQRSLIIIVFFFLVGCSRMYIDKRPVEETWWTVERARTFKDERSLEAKAEQYEDLLFTRHFGGDFLSTEIRLEDPTDVYGFSSPYVYKGFADVACYGGRLLAAMAFKYAVEIRETGEATSCTMARLTKTFEMADTLCRISGEPGLIVRGYRSKDIEYEEGADDKWYDGQGEYSRFRFRSEASPPQYSGVTTGLQICYLLGPEEFRGRIEGDMEAIGLYLIRNRYQIIDLDGLPTKVSEFDPNPPLLLIGSPWTGYLGIYLVRSVIPGSEIECFDAMAGNRAGLNLSLLKILRASAIISGNEEIEQEYLRLCQKEYAERAELAGVNVLGIMSAGDELSRFDSWMCLLWPEWRDTLADQEYQVHYWNGMERGWQWCKDMKHVATIQYCLLRGERDEQRIREFIEMLGTFPFPNRRWDIVNSNRPNIELQFWAEIGKSLGPLCSTESILPFYEREPNAWVWCRDPRRLDSEGDGTREFPYMDFLYAYWMTRYFEYLETGQ